MQNRFEALKAGLSNLFFEPSVPKNEYFRQGYYTPGYHQKNVGLEELNSCRPYTAISSHIDIVS